MGNLRRRTLSIFFNDDEFKKLKVVVSLSGLTISEYIREIILEKIEKDYKSFLKKG